MTDQPRRRYRHIEQAEADQMLDLYTRDKLSSVQIGRLLDRDPAIVRRVLHERGITTSKLKWDAPLAVRLLAQGVPMAEVVARVGKDAKSIRQYIARHKARGLIEDDLPSQT